jgi:branched-chain amino acid transport system ATP-binding protein
MDEICLEVKDLSIQFGGLKAVDKVSFQVKKGELAGLIGPNGAGKTTVFNMLTGVYAPTSGQVCLKSETIHGLKPHQISRKGVSRTFQNIRLFKNLSVLDNVLLGAHQHVQYGLLASVFQTREYLQEEARHHAEALELLNFFSLEKHAHEQAGSLPYGEQRKLEIARALATQPQLLLLDEPAAGMNHSETAQLTELIRKLRDHYKVTVLLIEHDMRLVMDICEHIVVLDHGEKIADGNAATVRASKKVIEAYLGTDTSDLEGGSHDS